MVPLHSSQMMSRSRSESLRSIITRKASGILRSPAPPVSSIELSPITGKSFRYSDISPSSNRPRPPEQHPLLQVWPLLSYRCFRCDCGYLKNHIMCLGDLVDKEQKLFNFCGGMFVVKGEMAECSRCRWCLLLLRCTEYSERRIGQWCTLAHFVGRRRRSWWPWSLCGRDSAPATCTEPASKTSPRRGRTSLWNKVYFERGIKLRTFLNYWGM